MAKHERSLDSTAPPERVWRLWSDVSTWPRWNPDVLAISLAGPFASGTRGSMTTKAGGIQQIELADVRPGQAFTLVTAPVPLSTFSFECRIAPGSQGSRISQGVSMRGPLGWLFSGMMGERMAEGFKPYSRGSPRRPRRLSSVAALLSVLGRADPARPRTLLALLDVECQRLGAPQAV